MQCTARPAPSAIVIKAEQPQGVRPTRLFGAIGRAGFRRHSCEVASHHDGPCWLDSPTLGMSSREHTVNDLQVDQSVESTDAAAADRCIPSGPTGCSSERRRLQPGEVQEAPFADLSVHRGPRLMQMAVFDRFRLVMSVIPGDQRLVLDGT